MALPPNSVSAADGLQAGLIPRLRGQLTALDGVVQQPAIRRALPSILIVMVGLIAMGAWLLLKEPARSALFPGMPEADKARVMEVLSTAGIEAALNVGTGDVEVTTADFHRAKMALAGEGLPTALPDGNAVLTELPMGASRSVEGARLRQAQEAELARSITEIAAITGARVHLALPERSAFLRDTQPPRASVFLQIAQGRVLDPVQVEAIVNLVSSSVPGMARTEVTVVDQMGRLLSRGADDPTALMNDRQMQQRLQMEGLYRSRIEAMLTPVVGPGNLSVQVTMDVDFTRSEITEERVDPKGTALRSEQENFSETSDPSSRGIPGAVSNMPPSEADMTGTGPSTGGASEVVTDTATNHTSAKTRNYEVSRRVATTQPATAQIRKVAAAIVIRAPKPDPEADPAAPAIPPALMADLERLAQGAIGFDQGRGDSVTIIAQPFQDEVTVIPAFWERMTWLPEVARNLALIAALGIVVLGVVRPMLQALMAAQAAAVPANVDPVTGAVEVGEGESLDLVQARLDSRRLKLAEQAMGANASREEKFAVLRQIAGEDPARIAIVLRRMMKDEIEEIS